MLYALPLLLLSLAANVYLLLRDRKRTKGNSHEYEQYLLLKQDLSKFAGGIIEFKRINPEDIFYRSAR